MKSSKDQIALRLKEVREVLGLTQREMAEALSVTPPAYLYVEKGSNALSNRLLSLLQHVLKVNQEYALEGKGDMFLMNTPVKKPPLYMLRTVYLIQRYIKSEGLTEADFAKELDLGISDLDYYFKQQAIPDAALEKIYRVFPELGAILKKDLEETGENAALQKRVIELEEELERSRKIIDKLLGKE